MSQDGHQERHSAAAGKAEAGTQERQGIWGQGDPTMPRTTGECQLTTGDAASHGEQAGD